MASPLLHKTIINKSAVVGSVMRLKKYLNFKRFGNLPLVLVLEQVSVLIYSRLING